MEYDSGDDGPGSGDVGKGYAAGTQAQLKFLPEHTPISFGSTWRRNGIWVSVFSSSTH